MSKTVQDLIAGTAGGVAQVKSTQGPSSQDTRLSCLTCRCWWDNLLILSKWWVKLFLLSVISSYEKFTFEDGMKRMQTSPKGTYSGMLHCAGGILKNEGPLAFYKVRIAEHALSAS